MDRRIAPRPPPPPQSPSLPPARSLPPIARKAQHPQVRFLIPSPRRHRHDVIHLKLDPLFLPLTAHRTAPPAALHHLPPHRRRQSPPIPLTPPAQQLRPRQLPHLVRRQQLARTPQTPPPPLVRRPPNRPVPPHHRQPRRSPNPPPHLLQIPHHVLVGVVARVPTRNPRRLQRPTPCPESSRNRRRPTPPPRPRIELRHLKRPPPHLPPKRLQRCHHVPIRNPPTPRLNLELKIIPLLIHAPRLPPFSRPHSPLPPARRPRTMGGPTQSYAFTSFSQPQIPQCPPLCRTNPVTPPHSPHPPRPTNPLSRGERQPVIRPSCH